MAYKKAYDNMSIVELIAVCGAQGIDYHNGDEILDADAIRELLGKKRKRSEPEAE